MKERKRMSANRPGGNDTPNTRGTTPDASPSTPSYGGAGTGATDLGTTRDTSTSLTTGGTGTGTATATAPSGGGIAGQAQEYGRKAQEYASQAKDYLSERASQVGDKLSDLRNADYTQMAENAKEYARQKPGQALLISAAAGFVIGLLLRGGSRR
jgi:ElaB/YqjD/DUF883 family membrane-anchored ribosome-binding protein